MDIELLNGVPGGPGLVAWFGGVLPRFHDAEVLTVTLDHAGATCSLRVHGFETTDAVDARGYYVTTRHAVVTFVVGELTELKLEDFAAQNALWSLDIARGPDAQFRIELAASVGLSGIVEGRTLAIGVEPGIPPTSQYRNDG